MIGYILLVLVVLVEGYVIWNLTEKTERLEDWIEDYFLQISAYAMAHDYVHGSNIEQGVIMICTPDLYYQEFKFDGEMMRKYRHQFLQRLSQFYGRNVA